ncbi:hypothetical protein NYP18_09305 [Corynebacterium sp. YIM 101645]|uniref:Uncharacterized protein n=1 Tax=Corynebacterium lemuris TaxID=1859292 RepID=A0ABT2FX84_9CORY|nr:hypothetical protein [Corynebacterium lemuris]MCS5479856.1 hypothetical protein [Corynebacterium lemuris]
MDPMTIIEDLSSDRANMLADITGIPREWALPATIALSAASVLLRFALSS